MIKKRYTTTQVGLLFGVTGMCIVNWCNEGKMDCFIIGSKTRQFNKEHIEKYIKIKNLPKSCLNVGMYTEIFESDLD